MTELSNAEKAVFGQDAVKDDKGNIIERGFGNLVDRAKAEGQKIVAKVEAVAEEVKTEAEDLFHDAEDELTKIEGEL